MNMKCRFLWMLIFFRVVSVAMAQEKVEVPCFIYVLNLKEPYRDPKNWNEKIRKVAQDHYQYFVDLEQEGKLLIAGRTKYEVDNPENFGIMVFYAASFEEADHIRLNDPGVKNNLMSARLHPFSIAVLKTNYD